VKVNLGLFGRGKSKTNKKKNKKVLAKWFELFSSQTLLLAGKISLCTPFRADLSAVPSVWANFGRVCCRFSGSKEKETPMAAELVGALYSRREIN